MSHDKDAEFLAALKNFETPRTVDSANIDICGTYNQVKPILTSILPFIKLIPRIGTGAYNAISALKQGLDLFCPSATSSAPASTPKRAG
jgi:hypothetical protein